MPDMHLQETRHDLTAVGAFDYSSLPADVAADARDVAQRVRSRHQRQIEAIIETGRDLAGIKDRLEHGQFLAWIEAEFGMNIRSAQRYVSAAEEFGDKCDTVSYLPPTAVYQLAAPSTPAPIREAVIQRLEAGERIQPDEIKEMVSEAKAKAKQEREEAKVTDAQRRRQQKLKEQRQREAAEAARAEEERRRREDAAVSEATAMLEICVGDDLPKLAALFADLNGGGLWKVRQAIIAKAKGDQP